MNSRLNIAPPPAPCQSTNTPPPTHPCGGRPTPPSRRHPYGTRPPRRGNPSGCPPYHRPPHRRPPHPPSFQTIPGHHPQPLPPCHSYQVPAVTPTPHPPSFLRRQESIPNNPRPSATPAPATNPPPHRPHRKPLPPSFQTILGHHSYQAPAPTPRHSCEGRNPYLTTHALTQSPLPPPIPHPTPQVQP